MPTLSARWLDVAVFWSPLSGQPAPLLLVFSFVLTLVATLVTLQVAQLARTATHRWQRRLALGSGTLALGVSLWSLHILGLLALRPSQPVLVFDLGAVLTWLASFATAGCALWAFAQPKARYGLPLLGLGLLLSLGFVLMHDIDRFWLAPGQAAPHAPVPLAVALTLAIPTTLALVLANGVNHAQRRWRLCLSAVLLGLAMVALHYSSFIGVPTDAAALSPESQTPRLLLALAIAACSLAVAIAVAALNVLVRSRLLMQRMRENESRMSAIVDTAVDGIIVINGQGCIQAFNPSAERLFGWRADEVIGRNISMLMPEPDRSHHDGYLKRFLATNERRVIGIGRETTALRKDGSTLPMRLAVGQVDVPGESLFVGFITDISERQALEASLRQTALRAEQAAAAKSTFLANMSHEIRTPMNAIIGFTELLLRSRLGDTQRRHLEVVRQSSRSLLGLLNDILDTTKLEKGMVDFETMPFSLQTLAEQLVASLRLSAETRGLRLTLVCDPHLAPAYLGDPLRLRQVLTNLLSNAIKFTLQGSVTLHLRQDGPCLHIEIQDTGIGMTPEQVERIFDPFAQADASISRQFGGTGLGTTIARQLVQQMQGELSVESQPGHGTTFHVRLPLPRAASAPAPVPPPIPARVLPPLRVLAADDVAQNLELLRLMLEADGHTVTTTSDGAELLPRYRESTFDLLLVDVHMPGTDGHAAARQIRAHEQAHGLPAVPILALTASVMEADRQAARDAGMNGFATKPVDFPALQREIQRLLAGQPEPSVSHAPSPTSPLLAGRPVIHWDDGVLRWGSTQRLSAAIQQFLDDDSTSLPDDCTPSPQGRTALGFQAHRLRGAAANLALAAFAEAIGQLEHLLSQSAATEADIAQQLTRVHRQRAAVHQALQAHAPPDTVTPIQCNPHAPQRHPQWPGPLQELLCQLGRGAIDDTALNDVVRHLHATERSEPAQHLQRHIDTFDLDAAAALLRSLPDMAVAPQ